MNPIISITFFVLEIHFQNDIFWIYIYNTDVKVKGNTGLIMISTLISIFYS